MTYRISRTIMIKEILFYWFPPIIWMVIIFPTNDYLNSKNTSNFIIPLLLLIVPTIDISTLELVHLMIRKVFHFLNYFTLAFLLYRAFTKGNKIFHFKKIIITGIITISYAILDEIIQLLIPSRTGSFYDFIIDLSGCISMICMIYFKSK